MFSIGDLVDKLIVENMKLFSTRDKLMELETDNKKNSRTYVELYTKMMLLNENRAVICNTLDDKINKVLTGQEKNEFLKKIRTYND